MTFIKLMSPICRSRNQLVFYNKIVFQQIRNCQNRSQSALSKQIKNEVDTNVKPLGEKVKETTKTASYLGIILLGVGVTGSLFYAVFNELFSSKSPNNVYSKAVQRCKDDVRIQDKLGVPITAHGAETSRRRRQHVTHVNFLRDGKQCLRMKFYLKGTVHQATVHLEMIENDYGKYEYRYLLVQIEDMLKTTFILEDNRQKATASPVLELSL